MVKKAGKSGFWGKVMRRIVLPLIVLAIIVLVAAWLWGSITARLGGIVNTVSSLLGWGVVLSVVGLIVAAAVLWRQPVSLFFRRLNRWLGGMAFFFAIWAILGVVGAGGSFGLSIAGTGFIGGLKIAGIIIIGIFLIIPRKSFNAARASSRWLAANLAGISFPRPHRQIVAVAPAGSAPAPPVVEAPPVKTVAAGPSPTELKQVAEEVWKKYGKSASLVTVGNWKLPPIEILDKTAEVELSPADNARRAKLIEESLASYGVEAKVIQINAGPTVTQFGVEPGWDRKMKEVRERDDDGNIHMRQEEVSRTRVKVERILSLSNDLALSLAAPSIRIEAPVPGKSMVGIEVPNTVSSSVSLRGVIETSAFQKALAKSKLTVALGKASAGEAVAADLAKMPHLLIAGATGSGKTVCLNAIISCLLLQNAPSEAQFVMIDPKRVELTPYNSIPHLVTPVIVDATKAIGALRWLSQEMDRRYQRFEKVTVRNIEGYNKDRSGDDRIPYLVVIIDELADLMMAGFDEVEHSLCRLAQLSRATGIHLIVATQRPSVDVVTGLIKANFPTRISFAVTSQVDSRTILDIAGAEKLLGKGDMLFAPTEAAKPKRLQGCYVSDPEIERLVYFWNSQHSERPAASLNLDDMMPPADAKKEGLPDDQLLAEARELAREYKSISASFLQRKLRIGYPRAARIMEQLEEEAKPADKESRTDKTSL